MKVAVAQLNCSLGEIEKNVAKIKEFAKRAAGAGAELVLFPEMADTGYSMRVILKYAQEWSNGTVTELQEIARQDGIMVVSGVSEREGEHIYNTQVVIDASGKIMGKYRKTHLFAVPPVQEERCFTCGNKLVALKQGDYCLGLTICYDLRFPELYRALAVEHGANVFLSSSAWPFPRMEHLRTLAAARAIENQSYMLLSNQVGMVNAAHFCGSSAIIDPAGIVIASASPEREELLIADISFELIESVREAMPVFAHRRSELYSGDTERVVEV